MVVIGSLWWRFLLVKRPDIVVSMLNRRYYRNLIQAKLALASVVALFLLVDLCSPVRVSDLTTCHIEDILLYTTPL